MQKYPRSRPATGSHQTAELLKLSEACADLLRSQRDLYQQLHIAGLITDRTAAALLAREDQIDAAISDLQTHLAG